MSEPTQSVPPATPADAPGAGPADAPRARPADDVPRAAAPDAPTTPSAPDAGWAPPSAPPGGAPPSASAPEPHTASEEQPARRQRPGWVPLTATAVGAALVASLATAGLTGAFEDDQPVATTTVEEAPAPQNAPVVGSTADDPDWQAVAAEVRPSVVAIDVRTASGAGQGSGVVIDADGHVLTNDHVVGGAVEGGLVVTVHDGRVLEAEIVGTDPTTDLAVIRLVDPPSDIAPAAFGDSEGVEVGEPVMAVGNPLGLDSTVTTGIVSAVDRPVTTQGEGSAVVTNAIQVDAAINPGNSGGPLFDAAGRVIGITSSIAMLPGGQSGSIGLGFAIPSALAERVAGELVEDGTAEHAFLGVALSDGTAEVDGVVRRGAVIQEVTEGSPADDAALQVGDVVVAIGDDPVGGAESLTAFVREHSAGEETTLTIARDGERTSVDVTFAVREEDPAQQPQQPDQQPDQGPPGGFPWDWFDR